MLPKDITDLILNFHWSHLGYIKKLKLHDELFTYFRRKLYQRMNEEFHFIFYPNFFQDLEFNIIHVPLSLT